MNAPCRAAALAIAGVLVLVACGDDDAPVLDPAATPAPDDDAAAASDSRDAPDATVAPDLPDVMVGEAGPVEVIGDVLPMHTLAPDQPMEDDAAFGSPAPVLVGQDFDGAPVRVDAVASGPTMLVFLAHWCSHCNAEIPRLNELRDTGRFPDELTIVGVSTAQRPGSPNFPPSRWVEDKDWTYPTIADGVNTENETYIAADAYGLGAFPFTVLIDSDGSVAARWSGERSPDEVIANIERYLGLT